MPWARSDVGSEAGENGKALSQRCLGGTKEGGAGTLVEVVARSGKMWFKSSVFPKGFDCSPQVAMLCKRIHRQLALTMPNPQGYLLLYALLFLFFFHHFFGLFLLEQGLIIKPGLSSNSLSPCFGLPKCWDCRRVGASVPGASSSF